MQVAVEGANVEHGVVTHTCTPSHKDRDVGGWCIKPIAHTVNQQTAPEYGSQ
jgi:hypothetical protein